MPWTRFITITFNPLIGRERKVPHCFQGQPLGTGRPLLRAVLGGKGGGTQCVTLV